MCRTSRNQAPAPRVLSVQEQSDREKAMNPERLDAVPLLAGLPRSDRAAVAAVAREAVAVAGDVLARDGEFLYDLIAVESGEAELFRGGELVALLKAGDVVGEIGAFERHLGTATIVARTAMRLITLSALDLRRLQRSEPAAVARMQGMLLRRRNRVAG
jgi:CRP-like cAMP-binding protein